MLVLLGGGVWLVLGLNGGLWAARGSASHHPTTRPPPNNTRTTQLHTQNKTTLEGVAIVTRHSVAYETVHVLVLNNTHLVMPIIINV